MPDTDPRTTAFIRHEEAHRVARDRVGTTVVSTVLIRPQDTPTGRTRAYYETALFGGSIDGETERYATMKDAREGHAAWVSAAEFGHVFYGPEQPAASAATAFWEALQATPVRERETVLRGLSHMYFPGLDVPAVLEGLTVDERTLPRKAAS